MSSILPIGPHEERLGRLDISGKHELSKSIDINEKVSDYLNVARENLATTSSYQHQTLKEIAKQNEQLKHFNDKIIRQYEEIQRQKYFQTGTKFPVSREPLLGSYVVDPEQVSPALKACEDRIKALEEEMSLRERDMVKMAGMVDLLVDENKYLRDHIASKNKDLTKVLETIGLNDGEAIHDLRHRLTLLGDENNILLQHLEDLKGERDEAEIKSRENLLQYQREKELHDSTKKKLDEALVREEILTNFKQQIEPKHRLVMEKLRETEVELQDTVEELDRTKNQLNLTTNQAQQYRKNLEELDSKKTLEVDKMIQEVSFLQNEKKELKKLLSEKDKQIDQQQSETKKYSRELAELKVEYEDLQRVRAQTKVDYEDAEQALELSQKKERELRNKNEDLQEEYERVKNKLRNIEDYYKKEIETLVNEHNAKLSKTEQALEHLKAKKVEILREKDNEILSLTDQVQDMKKVLTKVRNERDEGIQRLEELNSNEELTRRDKHINELVAQIEQLEGQLNDIAINKVSDPSVIERFDALKQKNQALTEENQRLRDTLAEAGLRTSPGDTQQSPGDRGESKNSQVFTQGDELNRSNIADLHKISDLSIKVRMLEDENTRLKAKIPVPGEKSKREQELERENVYLHNLLKNLAKDESIHRPSYNSVEYPTVRTAYNPPIQVSFAPSRSVANDRPINDYNVTVPTKAESPLKSQKEIDSLISTILKNNRFEETKSQSQLPESGYRSYLSPEYRSNNVSAPESQDTRSKADKIIDDILKKYQIDRVPEASDANLSKGDKILQNVAPKNESVRQSQTLNVQPVPVDSGKSPNVNFLSPLLSSAEIGSKANTLLYSNFLARDDIKTTDFLALNKSGDELGGNGGDKGGE